VAAEVHPTAVVYPGTVLGEGVKVLEFAVVGNRRAHRDVGGIDWRNAEGDELGGVDQ